MEKKYQRSIASRQKAANQHQIPNSMMNTTSGLNKNYASHVQTHQHQQQAQQQHTQQSTHKEQATSRLKAGQTISQIQAYPLQNNTPTINNNVKRKYKDLTSINISHMTHAAVTALAEANSKTLSVRNKNEEAINDLHTRIPEIVNFFDVHSRVGNGTFSTVLLGTLKRERDLAEHQKRKFAIKHHIPTSHPERIMKELQCMAKIG